MKSSFLFPWHLHIKKPKHLQQSIFNQTSNSEMHTHLANDISKACLSFGKSVYLNNDCELKSII